MRLQFEQGTLLLCDARPGLERLALPGVTWDARVGAWRAPAYLHEELHQALSRHGLSVLDDIPASWPPPAAWRSLSLRPYQDDALKAWLEHGRRGTVVLPTGAGKTRLAIAAIARTRMRALVLAPTRVLVEQWRREIALAYPGPVGCYGDGLQDLRAVTVATFESALRHAPRIGDRFDLLVVDEVHHAPARAEMLEMCVARARLGLSATPPPPGEALQEIARLVGPVCFRIGVDQLAGTYLSEVEILTERVDLDPEETRLYQAEMVRFRAFHRRFQDGFPAASWSEFARAASQHVEGREALLAWRRARALTAYPRAKSAAVGRLLEENREARILIFTADNASAYRIAREHLLMPLTSEIARGERERALRRFREGSLKALVSNRVLNEGLDVPDADLAILVGGSAGEREYAQRIGRLLRPGPGKRARVYELVTGGTFEVRQARGRREGFAARISAPL